jgi:hypothetical protein
VTGGHQPVVVSLNGDVDFTLAGAVTFDFKGLHPPAVADACFNVEATNRGSTNGEVACSTLLDTGTALQLKGTATDEATCIFTDDVTLEVKLTLKTNAAPGMTVRGAEAVGGRAWAALSDVGFCTRFAVFWCFSHVRASSVCHECMAITKVGVCSTALGLAAMRLAQ